MNMCAVKIIELSVNFGICRHPLTDWCALWKTSFHDQDVTKVLDRTRLFMLNGKYCIKLHCSGIMGNYSKQNQSAITEEGIP